MVKGYKIPEAESKILRINPKNVSRSLKSFRDHFQLDIKDEDIPNYPYITFPEGSERSTIIFTADVKR